MSEEKLYALKNDYGEWADTNYTFGSCAWVTPNKNRREEDVRRHGGHIVALIEEPKKVVLTKEQAEIVEYAHYAKCPASYISDHTDASNAEERLIIHAYFNGYTVAKDKKYGVWVPHVKDKMYYKDGRGSDDLDIASADCLNEKNQQFTEAEIEQYGLQDCEKVWCDSDD